MVTRKTGTHHVVTNGGFPGSGRLVGLVVVMMSVVTGMTRTLLVLVMAVLVGITRGRSTVVGVNVAVVFAVRRTEGRVTLTWGVLEVTELVLQLGGRVVARRRLKVDRRSRISTAGMGVVMVMLLGGWGSCSREDGRGLAVAISTVWINRCRLAGRPMPAGGNLDRRGTSDGDGDGYGLRRAVEAVDDVLITDGSRECRELFPRVGDFWVVWGRLMREYVRHFKPSSRMNFAKTGVFFLLLIYAEILRLVTSDVDTGI